MSPTYEYFCKECNLVTEEFVPMKDRKDKVPCSKCGKDAESSMTSSSFVVKGFSAANRYSRFNPRR